MFDGNMKPLSWLLVSLRFPNANRHPLLSRPLSRPLLRRAARPHAPSPRSPRRMGTFRTYTTAIRARYGQDVELEISMAIAKTNALSSSLQENAHDQHNRQN
jgi:hypothetical protein